MQLTKEQSGERAPLIYVVVSPLLPDSPWDDLKATHIILLVPRSTKLIVGTILAYWIIFYRLPASVEIYFVLWTFGGTSICSNKFALSIRLIKSWRIIGQTQLNGDYRDVVGNSLHRITIGRREKQKLK